MISAAHSTAKAKVGSVVASTIAMALMLGVGEAAAAVVSVVVRHGPAVLSHLIAAFVGACLATALWCWLGDVRRLD